MRIRPVLIALGFTVAAVVLQTTLFAPGRIQPLGVAPSLVVLVVVVSVRHLESEAALLVGFTGGLLVDALGGSPLGLWAMAVTAVAYAGVKFRDRADDGPLAVAAGVYGLTFLGQLIFVVAGTLFGLQTITDPQLVAKLLLPGAYNLALAVPAFWVMAAAMKRRQGSWVR